MTTINKTNTRRILLAVTGMSPQIVTETLYALGVGGNRTDAQEPFIPTEIHLLTTTTGAQEARTALLHEDGGQFHTLLADYPQLGQPRFDDTCIHIIRDAQGNPLADIRTPEENASAADTITALMAELTNDPDSTLHVSIAGGRKTMGFYLGYAFSLFARPQDELSHVLVSSPFEGHPEFFFKPATPRRLTTRDGRNIDTADAVITLAKIPVVRLRHGQPQSLLDGKATFNETVSAIQKSIEPARLRIDLRNKQVWCGGESVKLQAILLAWLAWWAHRRLSDAAPTNWRMASAQEFLDIYRQVVGLHSAMYEKTCERLKEGMEKNFFSENNAKLKAALRRQLQLSATPYFIQTSGKRPNTVYSLVLPASMIELHR